MVVQRVCMCYRRSNQLEIVVSDDEDAVASDTVSSGVAQDR